MQKILRILKFIFIIVGIFLIALSVFRYALFVSNPILDDSYGNDGGLVLWTLVIGVVMVVWSFFFGSKIKL